MILMKFEHNFYNKSKEILTLKHVCIFYIISVFKILCYLLLFSEYILFLRNFNSAFYVLWNSCDIQTIF